jgi:bacterial/archaeal transporter family-2 protein
MNGSQVLAVILCVAVGVSIAFQALLNARLGSLVRLNSYSALMSFVVGLPVAVVYYMVESKGATRGDYKDAPWWAYLGGMLGAFYIVSVIYAVQKLGALVVLSITIASQVIASAVTDHYGLLGSDPRAAGPGRITGAVLIVTGAAVTAFAG